MQQIESNIIQIKISNLFPKYLVGFHQTKREKKEVNSVSSFSFRMFLRFRRNSKSFIKNKIHEKKKLNVKMLWCAMA